jgi:hypothetical protein
MPEEEPTCPAASKMSTAQHVAVSSSLVPSINPTATRQILQRSRLRLWLHLLCLDLLHPQCPKGGGLSTVIGPKNGTDVGKSLSSLPTR